MKHFHIVFIFTMLLAFGACNEKELKEAQQQNQVLLEEAQEKEEALEDLLETMNVIEENLAQISRIETAIPVEAGQTPTRSQKERIGESINMINDIITKNNEEIESLNKKLEDSNYKDSSLKKLISRLKEENAQKAKTIIELNDKISALNIEIRGLQGEIYELAETVDVMSQKNIETESELKERENLLNQAFYTVGTNKELQERHIVSRSGGFIGIGKTTTLKSDFDIDTFTKIDQRETTFIPIETKKLEIITSHPESSYEIVGEQGAYEGIRIVEPKSFWMASKFLVVSVK